MARSKPSGSKTKAKTSATSAKPSARANKPVATSKAAKSSAAKSGAAKAGAAKSRAAKSPVAKSAAKKSPAKKAVASRTSETPRTRAPTVSVRDENPRTRAPTASGRTSDVSSARRDTVVDEPIDTTSSRDHRAEAADPARAAELAALEDQVETLNDPHLLVALAGRIDSLGMQLAYEISRHAHDAAHIAPLKPVLLSVPALYGKTLLRAAEKFDDQGSPRRAAYVLFEALRKAFDPDVITAVASALSFVLEAHGQSKPAHTIRALLTEREDRRAAGVDRREVRTQFSEALEALRDGGVDWDSLDDVDDQFD